MKTPYESGRAWIELNLKNLEHNVKAVKSILPRDCELMAVVKANAYGHGAVPIAFSLNAMGVNAFCVATITEAIQLRECGVIGEILILGYTHPVGRQSSVMTMRNYWILTRPTSGCTWRSTPACIASAWMSGTSIRYSRS